MRNRINRWHVHFSSECGCYITLSTLLHLSLRFFFSGALWLIIWSPSCAFRQCVEALLHPLNLKNRDEAKTMTDKFAAVCILQVHTPNTRVTLHYYCRFHVFNSIHYRWYIVHSVKLVSSCFSDTDDDPFLNRVILTTWTENWDLQISLKHKVAPRLHFKLNQGAKGTSSGRSDLYFEGGLLLPPCWLKYSSALHSFCELGSWQHFCFHALWKECAGMPIRSSSRCEWNS
jgi:hypothetical protein